MKTKLTITGIFNDCFTNYKDKESSISVIIDIEENSNCSDGKCLIHNTPEGYVLTKVNSLESNGFSFETGV